MAEVMDSVRRIALEGYIRAQWLSAELGGGRVEEAVTARRVMFRDSNIRPDWVYPGRHDAAGWEAASNYVNDSLRIGRPCLLVVDDAADRTLEDTYVAGLALSLNGTARCMVLPQLAARSATSDVEVNLEIVADQQGRETFVEAAARIFDAPIEMFEVLYPPGMLGSDAIQGAIARVDGAVAGVAAAYIADGAVGVYGVATDIPYRRRGIGELLTSWACQTGIHQGADFAYLQPSEMAQSLYHRMGFRDVGGYRKYSNQPASP